MVVNTSRFGKINVDDQRVITFPKGLLGFPRFKKYVLIEPGEDNYFFWFQAVDAPDLAFVVTDPSLFVPTYRVPIKAEQMRELGIESFHQAQVFVVVNQRDNV